MVSMQEALGTVLEHAQPLPLVSIRSDDPASLGCSVGQPVLAREPFPPFAASVMDGYAMLSSDGTGEFTVTGSATAGTDAAWVVEPGSVSYITTGAMVPAGAAARSVR